MSHETNLAVRQEELEMARKTLARMWGDARTKQIAYIARLELEIKTLEELIRGSVPPSP